MKELLVRLISKKRDGPAAKWGLGIRSFRVTSNGRSQRQRLQLNAGMTRDGGSQSRGYSIPQATRLPLQIRGFIHRKRLMVYLADATFT